MFPPPARPLPSFVSLLVHGPYPPSAPIHLCLSLVLDHLEYKSRPQTAIIFSSSTSKLTEELKGFRDEWLDMHAGHGRVAQALEGFKIFSCPTPGHLSYLLSMLRRRSEYPMEASTNNKVILDTAPSVIILHEPSAYFVGVNERRDHTLSSYLNLVAEVFNLSLSLKIRPTEKFPRIVLFDSRLENLKLPVLKTLTPPELSSPSRSRKPNESVLLAAQRYFEWHGKVEAPLRGDDFDIEEDHNPFTERDRAKFKHKLILTKPSPVSEDDEDADISEAVGHRTLMWEWTEQGGRQSPWSEHSSTQFA